MVIFASIKWHVFAGLLWQQSHIELSKIGHYNMAHPILTCDTQIENIM